MRLSDDKPMLIIQALCVLCLLLYSVTFCSHQFRPEPRTFDQAIKSRDPYFVAAVPKVRTLWQGLHLRPASAHAAIAKYLDTETESWQFYSLFGRSLQTAGYLNLAEKCLRLALKKEQSRFADASVVNASSDQWEYSSEPEFMNNHILRRDLANVYMDKIRAHRATLHEDPKILETLYKNAFSVDARNHQVWYSYQRFLRKYHRQQEADHAMEMAIKYGPQWQ